MTVTCTARQDGEVIHSALTGSLAMTDVVEVRTHLLKCLAEQPVALVVDLTGLTVTEPLSLAVLLAVTRQAGRWPGTPVLLAGPEPDTAGLLATAAYRRIPVFPDVDHAHRHATRAAVLPPTLSEELLPVAGSAHHGRNLVTDACLRWRVDGLIGPASLIASELIGNVVDHAHTMMTLRLSLWNRYFFIAVRDGSSVEPPTAVQLPEATAPGGRGLFLVDATAHSWGSLPALGGKVVWASLSAGKR